MDILLKRKIDEAIGVPNAAVAIDTKHTAVHTPYELLFDLGVAKVKKVS